MTADRTRTPLEHALLDVQASLADLLSAADEQHAAVAAGDRARLESVTRRQERLSARLERAERQRLALLDGRPMVEVIAGLPTDDAQRIEGLVQSIGSNVAALRERQAATASLLERSIDVASQTIQFLQRLVTSHAQAYTAGGLALPMRSLLVDSRA
ncbi:MAG TPA: flagellar export chaperone FlgN [Chloroflexota bacterium]|nr:flagellar export chaperone FlgN [Chloroflexota bacterium]